MPSNPYPYLEFYGQSISKTIAPDYKQHTGLQNAYVIDIESWIKFNLTDADMIRIGLDMLFGVSTVEELQNLVTKNDVFLRQPTWTGLTLVVFPDSKNLKIMPRFYVINYNMMTDDQWNTIASNLKLTKSILTDRIVSLT